MRKRMFLIVLSFVFCIMSFNVANAALGSCYNECEIYGGEYNPYGIDIYAYSQTWELLAQVNYISRIEADAILYKGDTYIGGSYSSSPPDTYDDALYHYIYNGLRTRFNVVGQGRVRYTDGSSSSDYSSDYGFFGYIQVK